MNQIPNNFIPLYEQLKKIPSDYGDPRYKVVVVRTSKILQGAFVPTFNDYRLPIPCKFVTASTQNTRSYRGLYEDGFNINDEQYLLSGIPRTVPLEKLTEDIEYYVVGALFDAAGRTVGGDVYEYVAIDTSKLLSLSVVLKKPVESRVLTIL